MEFFKDVRKVKFIKPMNGIPYVIGTKKISPTADRISFRKTTFEFDVGAPSYKQGRTFIYLVDIKHGQLTMSKHDMPVSPELIHATLRSSVISQLTSSLDRLDVWNLLMYIIVGVCMALPLGYVLGLALPIG
jgi:hypothetical protein